MRTFTNANARNLQEAVALAQEARREGQAVSFAGGGTDLLQLVKNKTVNRPGSGVPDVLVNLKAVSGLDQVTSRNDGGEHRRADHARRAERAPAHPRSVHGVGRSGGERREPPDPKCRHAGGERLPAAWCWYYRNGFPCYKAGGNQCFSVVGENQLHAIFGGGPSYIVHPSDTAPALVALDATFEIVGPEGERTLSASEFFVLPSQDPEHENVLGDDEVLAAIELPAPRAGVRSTYHKIMDREAWTHAVVSAAVVLEMNGDVCREARIVLGGVAPIPWRVPEAERLLVGQRVTPELASRVGEAAVAGAMPLAKNAYKVPLTKGVVERTVLTLATSA